MSEVAEGAAPTGEAAAPGGEDERVIVTIGDAPLPEDEGEEGGEHQQAPEWVKELRKKTREDAKRIRELETALAEKAKPAQGTDAAPTLGPKPKLSDPDINYDADELEEKLVAWFEAKRQIDEREAKAKREQEEQATTWQAKLDGYAKAKTELKVEDYEDAEAVTLGAINEVQHGIIVHASENPALLVYALGKNPEKAKELAAIADPIKFAIAIGKLETQLKITPRRTAPKPEPLPRGGGSGASASAAGDAQLEKLREEAAKTGDYSKVHAYRSQNRKG